MRSTEQMPYTEIGSKPKSFMRAFFIYFNTMNGQTIQSEKYLLKHSQLYIITKDKLNSILFI